MSSIALLLALAQPPPAPPPFTARWDGTSAAVVTFTLDAPACLYRQPLHAAPVLLACYAPGGYAVRIGRSGPLDAAMRPAAGDVYVLQGDGADRRAALRGVVWLALVEAGG